MSLWLGTERKSIDSVPLNIKKCREKPSLLGPNFGPKVKDLPYSPLLPGVVIPKSALRLGPLGLRP